MYKNKSWEELTLTDLHDMYILRQQVFVVEQDCAYLDADGLDPHSIHIYKREGNNSLSAYARILAPGLQYRDYTAIGRVVVDPAYRTHGFGREIMSYSIEICRQQFPLNPIKISAQQYLEKFYLSMGFISTGEKYLEDGIPHMSMILPLDK